MPSLRAMLRVSMLLLVLLMCLSSSNAQDRFYNQTPYDLIHLKRKQTLKVLPLKFPNRRVPAESDRGKLIELRLFDEPEKRYELRWSSIESVELFEQLILKETVRLVSAGNLEEAFDYFEHLRDRDPDLPGLDEAINDYLYEEAKVHHGDKETDAALAMLNELHDRQPDRPQLDKALGTTTDRLVEHYVEANDRRAARRLVADLARRYPENDVVGKWESAWEKQASVLLTHGRQAIGQGQMREADALVAEIKTVWPRLAGAREFAAEVHQHYPVVVIGVSSQTDRFEPDAMDDWASRRVARLIHRTLAEFVGPGPEGGRYVFPLGKVSIRELGLRIAVELKPDQRWSRGDATLTGYHLARRWTELAEPAHPDSRAEWVDLLDGVQVEGVYRVLADLRHPHVRPESLLQIAIPPDPNSGGTSSGTNETGGDSHGADSFGGNPSVSDSSKMPRWSNGPYQIDVSTPEETVYLANEHYFARGVQQPREIVERYFDNGNAAVWALRDRKIDALDRVNPWEIDLLRQSEDVVIEPYAVPLIHALLPNPDRPLTARRTFRRALVYGINRQAVLDRLLGGKKIAGCRVVSGPFSAGQSYEDPLAYAYNGEVPERPYLPRLGGALAQVALAELATIAEKTGGEAPKNVSIVLAHPPEEIARIACVSIAKQLEMIDIAVTLQEHPVGKPLPEEVDLLYVELAVWEPAVDARRLLDAKGLAHGTSPYMSLALRRLEQASQWRDVGAALREIHKIAHHDLAVIPLWQLVDHFAYHKSLNGVGSPCGSFYQNVEAWEAGFHYSAESP